MRFGRRRRHLYLFGLLLAGCSQSPTGQIHSLLRKPLPPSEPRPALNLIVSHQMDFKEGVFSSYPLKLTVPSGEPVVLISGLPEGALYNSETQSIDWEPDLLAANDPSNSSIMQKTFPITITLMSSEDAVTVMHREVLITVRDTDVPWEVQLSNSQPFFFEGRLNEQILTITSQDYPNGPFSVLPRNLPPGATLEADPAHPNVFHIFYSPSYDQVTSAEGVKQYQVEFRILTPTHREKALQSTWKVYHLEVRPQVLAPSFVKQAKEVNFILEAFDPNGEMVPTVTLKDPPAFGTLTIDTFNPSIRALPSVKKQVFWKQIPASQWGTTHRLYFEICTLRCLTKWLDVSFEEDNAPAPVMDRTSWERGSIAYMKAGSVLKLDLPVSAGHASEAPPEVQVVPVELKSAISWANGKLQVALTQEGLVEFSLRATSVFGKVTEEFFLVDVLPTSWGKTLFIVHDPNEAEVKESITLFDSYSVVHPLWHPLEGKLMVLRKQMFVGTGSVSEAESVVKIEQAINKVPDLVLSTPLLETFQGEIAAELSAKGIKFKGRFLDSSAIPLSDFQIIRATDSGLTAPIHSMSLEQALSAESNNPMLLELEADSTCQPKLYLHDPSGGARYLVAATCPRDSGTLLVAGFEWADLKTELADIGIPKTWLGELLP